MAQQQNSSMLIRPAQIDTLPFLDDAKKQTYKIGLARLWSTFEGNPQGSEAARDAEHKIRQASQKIMAEITKGNQSNRPGGNAGGAAPGARPPGTGGVAGQPGSVTQSNQQQATPNTQATAPIRASAQVQQQVNQITVNIPANIAPQNHVAYKQNWQRQFAQELTKKEQAIPKGRAAQQAIQQAHTNGAEVPPAVRQEYENARRIVTEADTKIAALKKMNDSHAPQNQQRPQTGQQPQPTNQTPQATGAPAPAPTQSQTQDQKPPVPTTAPTNPAVKPDPTPAPATAAPARPNFPQQTQNQAPPQQNGQNVGQAPPMQQQQQQMQQQPPQSAVQMQQPQQNFPQNQGQQLPAQQQRPPMNPQMAQQQAQMAQRQQQAQMANGSVPNNPNQQQQQGGQPLRSYSQQAALQAAQNHAMNQPSQPQPQQPQQMQQPHAQNGMPFNPQQGQAGPQHGAPSSNYPQSNMHGGGPAGGTPTNKFPIAKTLQLDPRAQQPVPGPAARPTLANQGMLAQPGLTRPQPFTLEGEGDHVLSKRKLDELVRQVTGSTDVSPEAGGLMPDVEEAVLKLADDFFDDLVTSACRLAKLRSSQTLEPRDIQIILERNYGLRIPGFSLDEARTAAKKFQPAAGWQSKMQAVQTAKTLGGVGKSDS